MNTKNNVFYSVIFSTLLALSAFPAQAVSFNSGPYNASRNNNVGTTTVNMTLSASTFCFLSKVNIEETDTGTESAQCKVTLGANVWTLTATLGKSSDADARCSAICYNN
jgi:hypothetical protein